MASLLDQIRQALAELELVSHAPTSGYGRDAHDTSDSKGGRRPPGADYEFRPRRPPSPLREGDAGSEKAWREFEEELAAWEACYHRRTVDHYRRLLVSRGPSDVLLADVRRTAQSWRRAPMVPGQPPLSVADPQWKRYIGECNDDAGVLATRYSVSRRYINMVRRAYREDAA